MKKLFIVFLLSLFLSSNASEMLDVDYNFIDTAFDGIKPVTNQQFDDTIKKMTPQPVENTFLGHLKAFLFGRKYGVDNKANANVQQKQEKSDIWSEKEAIDRIKNGVFYIKLVVSVVGKNGEIIPLGNYKIQEKIINNEPNLVFSQGQNIYGMLKLKDWEDNKKNENDITYSRVDIISDDTVRIVYSTISKTQCALAKVHLQN